MLFGEWEDTYYCYSCKKPFYRVPLLDDAKIMEIMNNFICTKCKRCYKCCKKMHKCNFKKEN